MTYDENQLRALIERDSGVFCYRVISIDTDANYGCCVGIGVAAAEWGTVGPAIVRASFEFAKSDDLTPEVIAISVRQQVRSDALRFVQRRAQAGGHTND